MIFKVASTPNHSMMILWKSASFMENTIFYSKPWAVPFFSSVHEDKLLKIQIDIYEMFHAPNSEEFWFFETFLGQGRWDLHFMKTRIHYRRATHI